MTQHMLLCYSTIIPEFRYIKLSHAGFLSSTEVHLPVTLRRQDELRSTFLMGPKGMDPIWLFLYIGSLVCGCPYNKSPTIWGLEWGP